MNEFPWQLLKTIKEYLILRKKQKEQSSKWISELEFSEEGKKKGYKQTIGTMSEGKIRAFVHFDSAPLIIPFPAMSESLGPHKK